VRLLSRGRLLSANRAIVALKGECIAVADVSIPMFGLSWLAMTAPGPCPSTLPQIQDGSHGRGNEEGSRAGDPLEIMLPRVLEVEAGARYEVLHGS
jgi:hypothetical protein